MLRMSSPRGRTVRETMPQTRRPKRHSPPTLVGGPPPGAGQSAQRRARHAGGKAASSSATAANSTSHPRQVAQVAAGHFLAQVGRPCWMLSKRTPMFLHRRTTFLPFRSNIIAKSDFPLQFLNTRIESSFVIGVSEEGTHRAHPLDTLATDRHRIVAPGRKRPQTRDWESSQHCHYLTVRRSEKQERGLSGKYQCRRVNPISQ